jgi:hypothetical protein
MTSQRLAFAALVAVLLGGVAGSAQIAVPSSTEGGMVAAVKAMHADLKAAIGANTRAQVLIARLASQDARIAAVTSQVVDAQRALWDAVRSRADTEAEVRTLTQILPGTQPKARAATPQELSEERQVLDDRERVEQAARARLATLQKSLDAEQAKRTELHARLDDLERGLAAAR